MATIRISNRGSEPVGVIVRNTQTNEDIQQVALQFGGEYNVPINPTTVVLVGELVKKEPVEAGPNPADKALHDIIHDSEDDG